MKLEFLKVVFGQRLLVHPPLDLFFVPDHEAVSAANYGMTSSEMLGDVAKTAGMHASRASIVPGLTVVVQPLEHLLFFAREADGTFASPGL